MDETLVIPVKRETRRSETVMRRVMAVLAAVFLLQGIMLSTAFMLPCFLMTLAYFWYGFAMKREYEYTLEDGQMRIERVSDRGRRCLYEIPLTEVVLLCAPDAPEAAPYKKHGSIPVKKEDYTSYREGVPYYTMIVKDEGKPLKLLLDLTPEAIRYIRRRNREAVKINETDLCLKTDTII